MSLVPAGGQPWGSGCCVQPLQTQAEKAIGAMGITQPAVTITTKGPVCPLPSVPIAWHRWAPSPRQPRGQGLSWLLASLQRLLTWLPSSGPASSSCRDEVLGKPRTAHTDLLQLSFKCILLPGSVPREPHASEQAQ